MKEPIRILLVDDHEVVRIGLRTLLSRYPNLSVVDDAGSASEAIEKALRHKPDVVIMDLRLPEEDGVQAIRTIREKCPQIRILVLTAFSDEELLFEAIAAGASGYILKEINSEKLVEALQAVVRGESLLDPRITERVLKKLKESPLRSESGAFDSLNFQEKRILALIAEGKSNRQIGERLRLSEKTIRNYVSQLLSKLGLHSRTQAAAYAIRHHLEIGFPSSGRS
ncbi:MAG: response regulator transcription factor [Candidatus Binatia bacterium]